MPFFYFMELIKSESFDLAAPAQALQVAEILQKFVKEKNLTSNIKGKSYPLVEAWQFAGSQLGLFPLLVSITDLSNEREIKYMATVEVRRMGSNDIVGRGIALCTNKESTKRQWDEYAILSMAQTRATGKAFRNLLAWLMKAAGFEATPAEEMDFKQEIVDVPTEEERQILRTLVYNSDLNDDEKEQAMTAIETLNDYQRYQKIQYRLDARQLPIDQIVNPSQTDINKHLKKAIK